MRRNLPGQSNHYAGGEEVAMNIERNLLNFEESKKQYIERYQEKFDIDLDQLKDDLILEIGCGQEAEFVKYCLENGLEKVYGLDILPPDESIKKELGGHYIVGDINNLPFEDESINHILMRAVFNPNDENNLIDKLPEILKKMKTGGELKVYPVWREREMKSMIDKLSEEPNISSDYEFIWKEKDTQEVQGKTMHKDLLVIIKK